MTASWFLVRTRTRMEFKARDSLLEREFTVYLPLMARDARTGRAGMEPMFPGYIPVMLQLGIDDTHKIKKAPGCVDLVRFGETLAQFPPQCIENLMLEADSLAIARNYKQGDEIRVRSGPFHDLRGTMEGLSGKDRADCLLEMLGGLTRVRLQLSVLEPM